jgi:hypothetical protein
MISGGSPMRSTSRKSTWPEKPMETGLFAPHRTISQIVFSV